MLGQNSLYPTVWTGRQRLAEMLADEKAMAPRVSRLIIIYFTFPNMDNLRYERDRLQRDLTNWVDEKLSEVFLLKL